MKSAATLLVGALLLAGCGDSSESEEPDGASSAETSAAEAPSEGSQPEGDGGDGSGAEREKPDGPAGTEIVASGSEFGEMLFDDREQAIYIFENDPKDESVCYDDCAEAWPPVVTKGEPVAGDGVDASLLGTVERDDGSSQVTYAGQPLYFYAHEAPGEVRCHNVDLNGGFWWVVGPDGERRP